LIIVGTGFFSQEVDVASQDPITGESNIAYTLHFYAGTHGEGLRQRARTAMNNGLALMVTEWGTVNADGDGGVDQASTQEWMMFMDLNDISHLNWSVHDKVEGASVLRPGASPNGGWALSDLTTSGLLVREIILDWNECIEAAEPVLLGDCDLNGVVNFADVPAMVTLLLSRTYLEQADCNLDNELNFSDIPAFVDILLGRINN